MFGLTKPTRVKKGAISIEISLSLALSVVILTVILSLFSANIEKIAEASGLYNYFFHRGEKVTTYNDQKYDATQTQVNVQLVADQGLTYYIDNALATIDKYKQTPPTTQAEIEDLAKATAIANVYGQLTQNDEILFTGDAYKITLDLNSKYIYIYANGKTIKCKTKNANTNNTNTDSDKYSMAQVILNAKFQ